MDKSTNIHRFYMRRALQLAKLGVGLTRPNPSVGAVIVHNNIIIGEGYTSPYGGPHAEVNAIQSVKNPKLLPTSTLYVSLEPCSHYGKTPPCSDLIVKEQIKKVFIGCEDDNPLVKGNGIKKLQESGCDVSVGILEDECKQHYKRFLTFHTKKRPYVILKWAETLDGFIAPKNKNEKAPVWITNTKSRQLVHKWRTEEQAILIGSNTVLMDNPSLTARNWKGQNPIRIVLDKRQKLSIEHNVFNNEVQTLIIDENCIEWRKTYQIAKQILNVLHSKNINSVIVEGGSKTLQTFIDEGLWDEARVFFGKTVFGSGTNAPRFKGVLINEDLIGTDTLKYYVKD